MSEGTRRRATRASAQEDSTPEITLGEARGTSSSPGVSRPRLPACPPVRPPPAAVAAVLQFPACTIALRAGEVSEGARKGRLSPAAAP